MNVVDSSGWIEYFLDSARAPYFASAIEQTDRLVVPALALFEVHKFLSRSISIAERDTCLNVMRRGTVVPITDARAIAASSAAQQHKLALADAVMYSVAREYQATLWTQDIDYQGLAGVNYAAKV
jgi:predicted nucleic acid-binding protein